MDPRRRLRSFLIGAHALALGAFGVLAGCGNDAGTGQPPITTPTGPDAGVAGGSSVGAAGSSALPTSPVAGRAAAVGGTGGASNTTGMIAGAGGSAVPNPPLTTSLVGPMPCNVSKTVAAKCQSCHAAAPIGGAPMPLMTVDDFHKPAKSNPSMKVYELSRLRVKDMARPMPPGGGMAATDVTMLDTWFGAGAPVGSEADKNCMAAPLPTGPHGGNGTYEPLVPLPGETCYEFAVHNGQTVSDNTKYDVITGEHYEQFYYKAPWPEGTVGTRFGTKLDNKAIVHHWLLFQSDELDEDGTHRTAPLPTLLGVNAVLLAGWAVGGTNLTMPEGIGFELPAKGSTLNIQWHYYNNGTAVQQDKSVVQVCTVPKAMVQNVATVTWVGNEDLNGNKWFGGAGMPPHQVSTFSGTCDPLREGMSPTEPIHIIGFWPHMHQLGTNMKAEINHVDGTKTTVFDKSFDFNYQVHYMQNHDLMPGDTLTATCTFNNTTDMGIPFGESTDTEMCYNFTFAYPAHALENHVISLIGATNTCW
jgi:hypothetical protein